MGSAGSADPTSSGEAAISLANVSDWKRLDVSRERGFLPDPDPIRSLPAAFEPIEEIAHELPKLLVSRRLHRTIEMLPELDLQTLTTLPELRRAMQILSYLGHAWVWGDRTPHDRIPAILAVPWCAVASRLGRPPVLSYASYALDNWRRIDPEGPIDLENIALIQNFLGGVDEEWFIGVHVEIEAKAAPLLRSVPTAQTAAAERDAGGLENALVAVSEALQSCVETLQRMPEQCDPYIYYRRVRPYIHGWKDHPALPHGVVYEGDTGLGPEPQRFRGETGAQSAIVPVLDALLGVAHQEDPLRVYLREMRTYMPPGHRAFLEAVERGPRVRDAVHSLAADSLTEIYDACLHWLEKFRSIHLEYAAEYIHRQSSAGGANPTSVGTGGTPFMQYLAKHRDETARARL